MSRFALLSSAFLLVLSSTARVEADSLTDNLGPRELAVGESMRASAVGSLSTVLNPAGLALNSQLVFEGSFGYRNQDSASIAAVSACDSTTPVSGCFYYHYLSSEPSLIGMDDDKRRLHEGGLTAARRISSNLLLGTNTHFFDYNSNVIGEEDVRGYSIDAGLIFQAAPSLSIAGVGYNLIGTDSVHHPRAIGSGVSLRPGQGSLGLSMDAVWNLDADKGERAGRYGGGGEYFLGGGQGGAGYPLRAGGVYDAGTDAGYVTLGLGYANSQIGLDIGGRKQVSGDGDELIISAGLRFVGATPQQQ